MRPPWEILFSRKRSVPAARRQPSAKKRNFRPGLEVLENRLCPSTGGISGYVFRDLTGNGLSADDAAQSGVTVQLYQDSTQPGVLDSGDPLVASRLSASNGSYSFGGLAAGRYFVKEITPNQFDRTAPTSGHYMVNLGDGQQVAIQNFANVPWINFGVVTNISYTVTTPQGVTRTVTKLRGNTVQGATVVARFTVVPNAAPVRLNLVSFNFPTPFYTASGVNQQTIAQLDAGLFGPGQHSLTVRIPNNYFQVDFTATSNNHPGYHLFSADNTGTRGPANPTGNPVTLRGTVWQASNPRVPLSGATVVFTRLSGSNPQYTTTTSANGTYTLSGLPAGNYTATARRPGYESVTQDLLRNVEDTIRDNIIINFSLPPQPATITNVSTTVDDLGQVRLTGTITDTHPEGPITVGVTWGDGSTNTYTYPTGATTNLDVTHPYTITPTTVTYPIGLTITTPGHPTTTASTTTTIVGNTPPTLADLVVTPGDEGGTVNLTGTISDPDLLNTFTLEVDWGDGSPETYFFPAGTTSFDVTHPYPDSPPTETGLDAYPILLTLTDNRGGQDTTSTSATVSNVAPTVSLGSPSITNLSTPSEWLLTVSGQFTDPGTLDTWTATVDYGDGSGAQKLTLNPDGTFTLSHVYADLPMTSYTVTVTITDDDGGVGVSTLTITLGPVEPLDEFPPRLFDLTHAIFDGVEEQSRMVIVDMLAE